MSPTEEDELTGIHCRLDELLAEQGLARRIVACTPTPAGALFLLLDSELVGTIPARLAGDEIGRLGLRTFDIPLPLPTVEVSMAWHPRHDADGAHRWLRRQVRAAVLGGTDAARANYSVPAVHNPSSG